MNRWIVVCAGLLLIFASWILAQEPFREDVQVTLVSLYVSALNASGEVQTGLTEADFSIAEDGVPQTISSFSAGNEDVPLTVAFLVDNSGSITANDLEMARSAGLLLLYEMKADDKMFLTAFRHDTSALVDPTFDKKKLENTLLAMKPRYGNTALYDAISLTAEKLNRELGRKVLILFSDGQDNSSVKHLNDLITGVAGLSDITILSVGTLFHETESSRLMAAQEYRKGREALEKLADITGGTAVFPESKAGMQKSLSDFRNLIRKQYTLGYYPTNNRRDNSWREITIICKKKGVNLSYRKGYVAPGPETSIHTEQTTSSQKSGSAPPQH
jgi:Ca-activated chloride channel family protein